MNHVCYLQTSTVILAGLGLAAMGYVGKYVLRAAPSLSQKMAEAMKTMPRLDAEVCMCTHLYLVIWNYS